MTALAVHDLLRDAAELVPGVLEYEIEELVAGLRPGTPDNAPLIGRLDDRVVVATGHYRNGILLAPITARLVAAELAGESEEHAFSPHRFASPEGGGVITVNGEPRELTGTVDELLDALGVEVRRGLAVAVDATVVPRGPMGDDADRGRRARRDRDGGAGWLTRCASPTASSARA